MPTDAPAIPAGQEFTQWDEAFELLLEQLSQPALLISSGGEVLSTNAVGRARLREFPGLASELHRRGPMAAAAHGLKWVEVPHSSAAFHLWMEIRPSTAELVVERAAQLWKLTRRQRQVVGMLLEGMTNEEMAAELQCARRTVEVHLTAILQKGGKETRGALVAALWKIAFGECAPKGGFTRMESSEAVEIDEPLSS